jgi:isopentenyl phosphate kinase
MKNKLIFIKLGGSLITDKRIPYTAHRDLISYLAKELLQSLQVDPSLQLLIGHGSGSFGHVPAHKFNTRNGVSTQEQWKGFWEVWKQANQLNQIVLEEFKINNIRIMTFSPSAMVTTSSHKIIHWDIYPIQTALENKIIPLVYGDVVFDRKLGGTILSTEEIFFHLAKKLQPSRIILLGKESGIYEDRSQQLSNR